MFRTLKRFIKNIYYLMKYDLATQQNKLELERTFRLTDKIIEDCIYEFDEDKELMKHLHILNSQESIEQLLKYPKSFCRFGDGEIQIMQGKNQAFQDYNEKLSKQLQELLCTPRDDIYVGINRAYFHSPINFSPRNRRFYRIYATEYRRFFLNLCNPDKTYLDAGFLTAYYRYDDTFDYVTHYHNMLKLFENKKIAIISGIGVLEKLKYDVFYKADEKIIIHGPNKNAYEKYEYLIAKIKNEVPKDFIICIILGMTAKIMVPILTDLGYMAWDVGHLAKDYDAYMCKTEKTEENQTRFWDPD